VWSVFVVVVNVVDNDPLELLAVPDEGAVEELAAQSADPSLGERIGDRGPDWCLEDVDALGAEDLVERGGELAASVAHQCLAAGECLAVAKGTAARGGDSG
jgi:hypothetical protein